MDLKLIFYIPLHIFSFSKLHETKRGAGGNDNTFSIKSLIKKEIISKYEYYWSENNIPGHN